MGSLLEVSAPEGARLVALGYLDQASAAGVRLLDLEDAQALHQFRVGMRRLRSCLLAYDDLLHDSVGKKQRRRLKRIANRTNPGRDAEVQLEWVKKLGENAEPTHTPGVRWIEQRIERRKHEAYDHVREELLEDFAELEGALRESLATYTVTYSVGEPSPLRPFRELAIDAMQASLTALTDELAKVKTIEDEAIAHAARIHGKRLRYLLEPFRNELEQAKDIVKRLKALQDLLGDLNDLHNLAATVGEGLEDNAVDQARRLREAATQGYDDIAGVLADDERPGLLSLISRIQTGRTTHFATLAVGWLGEGGLLDGLRRDIETLFAAMRGGAPEEDVEIERKYLLSGVPPICESRPHVDLDQGYLPGARLIERVRRKKTDAGEAFYRTVKLGTGVKRIEIEEECGKEVFGKLWSLTQGRRVRKRRYLVADGVGVTWEIDDFKDRELYLAELELPAEDAAVTIPEWLAPYLVREVTGEPAYVNANLAR